jgi:hypothetical protein
MIMGLWTISLSFRYPALEKAMIMNLDDDLERGGIMVGMMVGVLLVGELFGVAHAVMNSRISSIDELVSLDSSISAQ